MNRIIRILNNKATIVQDDCTIIEVDLECLNFKPTVGDYVQIFSNGDQKIILKTEDDLHKQRPKDNQPVTINKPSKQFTEPQEIISIPISNDASGSYTTGSNTSRWIALSILAVVIGIFVLGIYLQETPQSLAKDYLKKAELCLKTQKKSDCDASLKVIYKVADKLQHHEFSAEDGKNFFIYIDEHASPAVKEVFNGVQQSY